MSEWLQQRQWKHHAGRTTSLSHADEVIINKGGIEGYIVRTRFLERPHHRMVIKRFEIPNTSNPAAARSISMDRARRSLEHYKNLKAIGVRVPTTYRLHESEPEIIMTDLSANGKRLVLSVNNEPNKDDDAEIRAKLLTVEQINSIFRQIQHIAERASRGGYYVAGDSYLIVVPKGDSDRADVVVTDYGGCMRTDIEDEDDEKIEHTHYETLRVARKSLTQLLEKHTTMSRMEIDMLLDQRKFPRSKPSVWD